MRESIVSDTTALIILGKLNRFDLFENIFQKVYIPESVFSELSKKDDDIQKMVDKNRLFCIKEITDIETFKLLDGVLDIGESEAIVLAKELQMILLIDEKKGRMVAKSMGLEIIGLLGLLLLNVKKEYTSKEDAKKMLEDIKSLNFRISIKLHEQFLDKLEELN